jgi:hypothetical protein
MLFYGYKNHIKPDSGTKLIMTYAVTDASVHDSQELETLIDRDDAGQKLYADSAYIGQDESIDLCGNTTSEVAVWGWRCPPQTRYGAGKTAPQQRTAGVFRLRGQTSLHFATARSAALHSHRSIARPAPVPERAERFKSKAGQGALIGVPTLRMKSFLPCHQTQWLGMAAEQRRIAGFACCLTAAAWGAGIARRKRAAGADSATEVAGEL